MKKPTILILGVVLLIGLLASSVAIAYQGSSNPGPNYTEDRHDSMTAAFDEFDYATWKSLMTENGRSPRVVELVTEENFPTFVALHYAQLEGDVESITSLREELGLNSVGKRMGGSQRGSGQEAGNSMGGGSRGLQSGTCLVN